MPSDPPSPSLPPLRVATDANVEKAHDPTIGSVLSERYLIHSLIGEGGMGKVYAGEHVLMRKRVAIKILHKELTTVPDVVQRFEREAMAAANIDHPNVAAATDFGHLPNGSVFLVLEYVHGISLRSEIAEGPMAAVRALHIARQIASAMASAHARGIVHRDLKPENVMLVEKAGDPDFVKVLDFGIAKVRIEGGAGRDSLRPGKIITKVGMIFGTPEYMAPEQALGEDADGRADQFALGVMVFEMLTGRRPYRGTNQVGILGQQLQGRPPRLADVAPTVVVPDGLDDILTKMLATDREQRFASAREAGEAIESQLLMLQPNLLMIGSRPDASLGGGALGEGPISSRSRGHLGAAVQAASLPDGVGARDRASKWTGAVYLRLPSVLGHRLSGLPTQLVLALAAGLAVGALGVAVSLIVVATRTEHGGKRRSSAAPASASTGSPVRTSWSERAPTTELAFARSNGTDALEALFEKYPADISIIIEIAKLQFASGDYSAGVASIGRALTITPKVAEQAEVATLIWKAAQKRESSESAFELLEGSMGARGANILYDLATTEGVRHEIKVRAEEFFASGRYRERSTAALVALIGLETATSCDDRRRFVEQAMIVGDERFVAPIEELQARVGCDPKSQDDCNTCLGDSDLLERAVEVLRTRPVSHVKD